jgi:hypothetical protein
VKQNLRHSSPESIHSPSPTRIKDRHGYETILRQGLRSRTALWQDNCLCWLRQSRPCTGSESCEPSNRILRETCDKLTGEQRDTIKAESISQPPKVIIANSKDSYAAKADEDGFGFTTDWADAAAEADVLFLLVPDQVGIKNNDA